MKKMTRLDHVRMPLVEDVWKQGATSGDAMATSLGSREAPIPMRRISIDTEGPGAFTSLAHCV